MTIKRHGGVFGRNPEFHDVAVETLDVSGAATLGPDAANLVITGPTLAASGTDANIDVNIDAKGSGVAYLNGAWGVNASGTLVPAADNSYDIGNGFNNPRDLNLSRDAYIKGNVVLGTSGKGIDFSADPSAAGMTSELFDDYEEGTWTATLTDGTNSVALGNGTYTKIGRSVFVILDAYSKSMAGLNTAVNLTITGLPFVPGNGSLTAWTPSLNVASTSFAIYCGTNGIISPFRTSNVVDYSGVPLSVFGSPGSMTWQFEANYSV